MASKARKRPARIVSPLDVSNSMWLTRNGLRARNLTIMQVLDPAVVKVKSSSVPMLSSSAVRQVLTTRSRKSKKGYTYLLNDLGHVDLKKYEKDLTAVISEYKQRLDAIMWRKLSQKERDRFGESWPVSYLQNQTAYHQAMDNLGWPISYYEVQLLVDEIFLAEFYLKQCRLLLNINSQVFVQFDELGTTLQRDVRYHEGAKVVARDTDDGFYYNGIIQQCLSSRKFVVRFCFGKEVIVSKKHCHLKNKDRKTATFKICDCVLVNTGANSEEACYSPGLIIGIPGKYQLKNSDYIILLYDCTKVFAFKEDLIRIKSGSYAKTVRYIERHWQPDADISSDESTTDTMDDLIKSDLVTTALSEASSSTDDEDDDPNQQIADDLHENLKLCEEKLAQATAEQAALKEMLKSHGDQIHELLLTVGKKLVKN